MVLNRENEISSFDPLAIEKLQFKLDEIENKRKFLKEFNKKARKQKTKPYPPSDLENLRNMAIYYKKRIKFLEENRKQKKNEFKINNTKIIENFKECSLEFYFKEPPFYKIIKELQKNSFIWNNNKKCWNRVLTKDNSKYLEIIS